VDPPSVVRLGFKGGFIQLGFTDIGTIKLSSISLRTFISAGVWINSPPDTKKVLKKICLKKPTINFVDDFESL